MLKRTLTAAAVSAVALTTFTAPAHAARAQECTAIGTATFTPPLSPTIVIGGSLVWDYDFTCVVVESNGATGLWSGHNTLSRTYNGSCIAAEIRDGELVGGIAGVTVSLDTPIGARVIALVPTGLNPCAMETAIFVNTGPDLFLAP